MTGLLGSEPGGLAALRVVWLGTGNNVRLTTEHRAPSASNSTRPASLASASSGRGRVPPPEPPRLGGRRAATPRGRRHRSRQGVAVEGRPQGTVVLGSYDPWSRVVAAFSTWPACAASSGISPTSALSDDEGGQYQGPVVGVVEKKEDEPALVSELFDLASHPDVALPLPGANDHAPWTRLWSVPGVKPQPDLRPAPGLKVKIVRPETQRDDKKPAWRLLRPGEHGGLRGIRGVLASGENSKTHIGESQKSDPEFSPGPQPPVTARNPPCREPGEDDRRTLPWTRRLRPGSALGWRPPLSWPSSEASGSP